MWVRSNLFLKSTQFTHSRNLALIVPTASDSENVLETFCFDSEEKAHVVGAQGESPGHESQAPGSGSSLADSELRAPGKFLASSGLPRIMRTNWVVSYMGPPSLHTSRAVT